MEHVKLTCPIPTQQHINDCFTLPKAQSALAHSVRDAHIKAKQLVPLCILNMPKIWLVLFDPILTAPVQAISKRFSCIETTRGPPRVAK